MSEIVTTADITVRLVQQCGSDSTVIAAAKASTEGSASVERLEQDAKTGLLRFLMRQRHGVPWEHTLFTWTVHAPIFVFRELVKHRIGVSISEHSARYSEVEPVFWVPPHGRKIKPVEGYKPARPEFVEDERVRGFAFYEMHDAYITAWDSYKNMLTDGVAKEVARSILPVGTYSFAYVTMNCRSLMAFLALRTHDPKANHPSYPQAEIEQVARQMESDFERLYPISYSAFNEFGRECP